LSQHTTRHSQAAISPNCQRRTPPPIWKCTAGAMDLDLHIYLYFVSGGKRHRRQGRLQVGFGRIYAVFIGQIYAVFLAKIYALWVFLENTAYNTGRFFWAYNTRRIFYGLAQCIQDPCWPAGALALGRYERLSQRRSAGGSQTKQIEEGGIRYKVLKNDQPTPPKNTFFIWFCTTSVLPVPQRPRSSFGCPCPTKKNVRK
jgi:hypothetical protein